MTNHKARVRVGFSQIETSFASLNCRITWKHSWRIRKFNHEQQETRVLLVGGSTIPLYASCGFGHNYTTPIWRQWWDWQA